MIALPKPAQARIEALERDQADADALTGVARAKLEEARNTLFKARLNGEATAIQSGELAVAAGEQLLQSRQARFRNNAAVISRVRTYLNALPSNAVAEVIPRRPLKQKRNETHQQLIERARADVNRIRAELQAVQRAPRTHAELRDSATRHVAELAKRGAPKVSCDATGDLRIDWSVQHSWQQAGSAAVRPIELAAFLHGPAMVAALHAEIEKIPATAAISAADRIERIQTLEAELLDAEVFENDCVTAAQAAGLDVLRRPALDPRAVLGIRAPGRAVARAA